MAPIKLEENIREKLEKRTLQPSANAWQGLEQKLNADKKEQNKNKFLWFGIAASIIAFLFVVQQFVTLDNTNSVMSPIVDESENETITNPKKPTLILQEIKQVVQEQVEEIPVNQKLNTVSAYKTTAKKQKEKQPLSLNVAIITKDKNIPKVLNALIIPQDNNVVSFVNTIDSTKNKEIQNAASTTSESEIEALLHAANKNMQLSNNNLTLISVDANALLEDVETEMPPSLRGQLFKVIEKNIKTVTTAVTTRNE